MTNYTRIGMAIPFGEVSKEEVADSAAGAIFADKGTHVPAHPCGPYIMVVHGKTDIVETMHDTLKGLVWTERGVGGEHVTSGWTFINYNAMRLVYEMMAGTRLAAAYFFAKKGYEHGPTVVPISNAA